ncbi:hypothetical protein [Mucilaginibacter sp.]|uniref:hypothetical protein n=1 Tax=Mucilaginibacter sp. TaxID=1882438 RepID=UPI002613D841|nr:hypothetical protein [Mucilaginibacter sp.]MDB4927300.1 hypothetical protein [Mucilaginibacter sp.]
MNYSELKTVEEKLDMVLQYVVNIPSRELLTRDQIASNMDVVPYEKEITEILLKLYKDGYVHTQNDMGLGYFYSNFDGRIFIDGGGYVKAKEIYETNLKVSSHILTQDKIYRRRLLWATWSAGIAAFLLLLWNGFLWINPTYYDFPYILFGIVRKAMH